MRAILSKMQGAEERGGKAMAKSAKKPLTKRWWFWPVVVILAVSAIVGSGNNDKEEEGQEVRKSLEDVEDGNEVTSSDDDPEPAGAEGKKSGTYTLPCGMKIQFWDEVRNDVTGEWRRAATSDSLVPADYGLEYYQEMFSSDDEIHSVWNATLKTTTRISVSGGLLFVDTFEYIDGEEHDAKIMFSGELLDSRIIDVETGELCEEAENESPGDEENTQNVESGTSDHTGPDTKQIVNPEPEPETSPESQPKPEQVLAPEPDQNPEAAPEPKPEPDPEPVITPEPEPDQKPEPEKTIKGKSSNTIVYVSKRSNTIHSVNDCGGMKNYREMTLGDADSRGYKYCPNCW